MKALAVLILAGCASNAALPPVTSPQCAAFKRIIGEAKLYGRIVKLEAHGTFTVIAVRNDLHLSPINVTTAGRHLFIRAGGAKQWTADSRFVVVSQALLSYVPGKVTIRATVCDGT